MHSSDTSGSIRYIFPWRMPPLTAPSDTQSTERQANINQAAINAPLASCTRLHQPPEIILAMGAANEYNLNSNESSHFPSKSRYELERLTQLLPQRSLSGWLSWWLGISPGRTVTPIVMLIRVGFSGTRSSHSIIRAGKCGAMVTASKPRKIPKY